MFNEMIFTREELFEILNKLHPKAFSRDIVNLVWDFNPIICDVCDKCCVLCSYYCCNVRCLKHRQQPLYCARVEYERMINRYNRTNKTSEEKEDSESEDGK